MASGLATRAYRQGAAGYPKLPAGAEYARMVLISGSGDQPGTGFNQDFAIDDYARLQRGVPLYVKTRSFVAGIPILGNRRIYTSAVDGSGAYSPGWSLAQFLQENAARNAQNQQDSKAGGFEKAAQVGLAVGASLIGGEILAAAMAPAGSAAEIGVATASDAGSAATAGLGGAADAGAAAAASGAEAAGAAEATGAALPGVEVAGVNTGLSTGSAYLDKYVAARATKFVAQTLAKPQPRVPTMQEQPQQQDQAQPEPAKVNWAVIGAVALGAAKVLALI